MIKSLMLNIMIMYPLILNSFMIMIMINPSKINKFHPMNLMLLLIMLIFFITIKMNFIFYSWMSFIMFLAMIGGLMIIYMYITSLTNNEMFHMNLKLILINILKLIPLMILYWIININMPLNMLMKLNIQDSWDFNFLFSFNKFNLNILFNEMNNKSMYFIMLYIYFSMICIMNICYKMKAPLRQMTF